MGIYRRINIFVSHDAQAIGFGGDTMTSAQDFIICEVFQDGGADCVDRQPVER